MLGTNDLFKYFSNSPKQVGEMLDKFIAKIKMHKYTVGLCPEILIITPPKINANLASKVFEVDETSETKSIKLDDEYKNIAKKNFCFHISSLNLQVDTDGLHFNLESHKELADRIYSKIKEIF